MRWIALAVVLIGCGSGGETREDALAGTRWGLDYSGIACSEGVGFNLDQSYENVVLCELTDGSLAAQIVAGFYSVDGNRLMIANERASCPDVPPLVNLTFAMTSSSLTLSSTTGGAVYTRLPPPSGSGTVAYGCFGTDGAFSPMPIRAL